MGWEKNKVFMKRGGSVSEWRDRMKYTRNDFKNQNSQSKKSFYVAACAVLACAAVLGTAYFQTQKTGNTGNSKLAEQPVATTAGEAAINKKWEVDAQDIAGNDSKQASTTMNAENQTTAKNKKNVEVKANKKQTTARKSSKATMMSAAQRTFNEEKGLSWPVKGDVLMKFSQSNNIYFKTLAQYKSNPAIEISADEGTKVIASAAGTVTEISKDDVTGTMVTTDIGSNYKITYGQLKNIKVKKGDEIKEGQLLGNVAAPTKYFSEEGSNLFFQVKENDKAVDPLLLLN